MYINLNNHVINTYKTPKIAERNKYPKLMKLTKDTVSFGAMKKNQFDSIDLVVVNKFKAQIQTFKDNQAFQNWCNTELKNKYLNKEYKSRQEDITEERLLILKEWFDNSGYYNDAAKLLIIDGITKNLKENNDTLPPIFDKEILDNTLEEIKNNSQKNRNYQVDFNKLYCTNLKKKYISESLEDGNTTGWIIIPSKQHNSKDFERNVNKLQTLSHDSWCTKSILAKHVLTYGDFHIYLENCNPKVGIRFNNDEVDEIQGEKNDYRIPLKYLDMIGEYTKNKKLSKCIIDDFKLALKTKNKIENFQKDLSKPINGATTDELFTLAGFEYKRDDKDNMIILKTYKQPDSDFDWDDLGVNENNFFKEIKEIQEDANFIGSNATHLGQLQIIGNEADFRHSRIIDLGNLKVIGGNAMFQDSQIKNLGNLETINGDAYFNYSTITNIGKLKKVNGLCYANEEGIRKMLNSIGIFNIIYETKI